MTGVVDFHAFRQQPFASALATAGKTSASAFGAHARAKTVLILSGALRALKCSFHNVACWEALPYGSRRLCQFLHRNRARAPARARSVQVDHDHEHEHEGRHIPHCHSLLFME
jgi:hypothetical protein